MDYTSIGCLKTTNREGIAQDSFFLFQHKKTFDRYRVVNMSEKNDEFVKIPL